MPVGIPMDAGEKPAIWSDIRGPLFDKLKSLSVGSKMGKQVWWLKPPASIYRLVEDHVRTAHLITIGSSARRDIQSALRLWPAYCSTSMQALKIVSAPLPRQKLACNTPLDHNAADGVPPRGV